MAYELDNGNVVCEQCGNDYKQIGSHWSKSKSCYHTDLSKLKKDILVGSLMGDGYVGAKHGKNQNMTIRWGSEEQCRWLDGVLGWMSSNIDLFKTAKEKAEDCRESGFSPNAKVENYNDMYFVQTRSHPFITSLTSWYGDSGHGDKCWPSDISLSPTVLLLLYVSDGCYADSGSERHIQIALSNEVNNERKVSSYFTRVKLPNHTNWSTYERNDGGIDCSAVWTVAGSKQLFEYMDQSPLMDDGVPDGFEYKFPVEYGGTGKSMDDVMY